jgi:hypothetical protein
MSAKMNWPPVRIENNARRSGSEWIGSDARRRAEKPSRREDNTCSLSLAN